VFISLVLAACSGEVEEAKQLLEDSLGLRKPLEFRQVQTFPGGVVCGEYRANKHGVWTRYRPFLTVRGELYKQPTQRDWDIFCGETPSQALLDATGIGPYVAGNTELAQVTADLSALDRALESYYRDHDFYPTMEQGLGALVSPPQQMRSSGKDPAGGYLESIPVDPWGRSYLYMEEQWGRTKGSFVITTLGADGVEGGGGRNADIQSTLLPYLRHIAVVLGKE